MLHTTIGTATTLVAHCYRQHACMYALVISMHTSFHITCNISFSRLEREHNILEKEYNRQPKKEELEQHIKEIGKSVDGLNDEISLVRLYRIRMRAGNFYTYQIK